MSKKELTIIKLKKDEHYVRIPEGRNFIESLKEIHKKTGAKFAHVTHSLGGGFKNIKMYHSKVNAETIIFPGPAELLNAQISFTKNKSDGSVFVHCHATLSHDNKKLSAFGGHLTDADVGITTEMTIRTSDIEVLRSNREDGLPLILTSKGAGRLNNRQLIIIISFMIIIIWLSVITFFLVKKN